MNVKEFILVPRGTYEELVDKHSKYAELLASKETEKSYVEPKSIGDLENKEEQERQEKIPENYEIPEIKEAADMKFLENNRSQSKKKKKSPKKKEKTPNLTKHDRWVPYP